MRRIFGPGVAPARNRSFIGLVVGLAVLLGVQGVLGRYQVAVVTTILLYVCLAAAWNLIGGIAGQFSLASSAIIGVGAYAAIMLLRGLGVPIAIALAFAVVAGAAFAAVLGVILFRLRGFYFTIGTLAAALATMTWMTTWEFTGGTRGISAPLALIPDSRALYIWAVAAAGLAVAVSILVIHSSLGLRLRSVRDGEDIADSLGISPFGMKMTAMVISGALTALGGALFALQKASIEPFSAFGLDWSITIIVMTIVGGLGSVWGPVIGVVVIYYGITIQLQSLPAVSALLSGLILVLVIRFLPGGILGAVAAGVQRVRARRTADPVRAD